MNSKNGKVGRQQVSLDDSFEENERRAELMATQQDKSKRIIEASFPDNRIPSSYQGKRNDSQYKKTDFDLEIDERPTRERPTRGVSKDITTNNAL